MKLSRIVPAASLLLLVCFAATAQERPELLSAGQVEIKSLQGLDSVTVEVSSTINIGVYEPQSIKAAIVKRLKGANVPVLGLMGPQAGKLVVTITKLDDVAQVRVRLFRLASTNCENAFFTSMWEREKLVKRGGLVSTIVELVDSFAADVNSINRR
jgi:hypothetical protein